MSSSSVWRPDCHLRSSRRQRRWRLSLILLCATAVACSHAPDIWRLAGAGWLLLQSWRLWRAPGAEQQVAVLRAIPSGWRLSLPDGEIVYADIDGPVRDWPGLLCLDLREQPEGLPAGRRPRRWRLALWSDQLPAQDWRRLRVWLRWRRREVPELRRPAPDAATRSTA